MRSKSLFFLLIFILLFLGFSCSLYFFMPEEESPPLFKRVAVQTRYPQELYLVAGGDIMLSRNIGYLSKKEGYARMFSGENYHPLTQFDCYAEGNCLLSFNLESMFSEQDNDTPKSSFIFKSHTGNIQTLLDLKQKNILSLSLANNHVHNAGGAWVALTRSWLEEHQIPFFWAGNSQEEADLFFVHQQGDIKLCFQAYSYDGGKNVYGGQWIFWNTVEKKRILEDLEKMQAMNCDAKIPILHRGAEYRISPNKSQIALAHELVDAGADLILWGHSHVPGKYELYKGKPIFYSLGNFIFDQDWGMRATKREFDYIYDYELERRTVPTYISLLAGIKFVKTESDFSLVIDQLAFSRMAKGVFAPLDEKTKEGLLKEMAF